MTQPLIGLTTYLTRGQMTTYDSLLAVLPHQYVEGVTRAGGNAVLLPPQALSASDATELVRRLDGLIITGGEDVNPKRYGQTPGPHTESSVDVRDDYEATLLEAALDAGLPVLGICRGAQMLNVHLGGTLHQHLPDIVGHHRYQVGDGVFHPEEMSLEPGSRVAEIFGSTTTVGHVYHHQGIDRVASRLTVTARGFDGIPQAVELDDYPFCLAVQWHPEEDLSELALFSALVEAAST